MGLSVKSASDPGSVSPGQRACVCLHRDEVASAERAGADQAGGGVGGQYVGQQAHGKSGRGVPLPLEVSAASYACQIMSATVRLAGMKGSTCSV